jgi:hypothetical protein
MNFVLTVQGWPQRAGHECRRLPQDGRSDGSLRQCAVLLPYGTLNWPKERPSKVVQLTVPVIKKGSYRLTTCHIGTCSTSLPRVPKKRTLYHMGFNIYIYIYIYIYITCILIAFDSDNRPLLFSHNSERDRECTGVGTEEVASASEGASNWRLRGFLFCTHQQISSG